MAPVPIITSLTPDAGPVGTSVTIAGTAFGNSPGTVTFNDVLAAITSWSVSSIVAIVPAGATTGPVVVTSLVASSAGFEFTVTATNQYVWITYSQARKQLAARLADPANIFWTDDELKVYLCEALRTWNAFTEQQNADFAFSATSSATWYDLSTLTNSPRLRTLTDADLYTAMQYALLEPPTGAGTWTGTSQFSLADLQGALQRRRDEMIQVSGCNLAQLSPIASVLNGRRTYFPDSTLEPIRTRFLPDSTSGAITLSREDSIAFDAFEPSHLQASQLPTAWSLITEPPLAMDVDYPPGVTGNFDVISLQAGLDFAPPAATLLGVPDDWSWLVKWGALADLLSRDSEATDRQRADYCLKRYMDGLTVMRQSNWLVSASLGGIPCDTPALRAMDGFSPEWQDNPSAWPSVVQAGMDLVAPCPVPSGAQVIGVVVTVVGNATIPSADGDFVQVSKDVFDAILDYAQVLASFKQGGEEFAATKDLESNFYALAMATNKRLSKLGLFRDVIGETGKKQGRSQPR